MRLRSYVLGLLMAVGLGLQANPADAQTYATGALTTDPAYYNLVPVSASLLPDFKRKVDLSPFLPPPGQQGQLGSCVGWAIAYATRSFVAGQQSAPGWPLSSPAGQFSPMFVYNEMKARNPGFCDKQGLVVSQALQFVQAVGVVPLSLFPYDEGGCSLRPSSALVSQANAWRIKEFAALGPWGAVPLDKIIEALDAGRPVILTIGADLALSTYRGGVLDSYAGPVRGYHAIVAVGYDRDAGTLKLMNSWGPDWGEAGTMRVGFATAQRMIYEAYVVLDAAALDKPVPIPAPAPGPAPAPAPVPVPQPGPPVSDLAVRYNSWFDAIEAGNLGAVRSGLEAGLRPDIEVGNDTGLELAIDYGNVGMLKLMLRYRPRLNVYVRGPGNYLVLARIAENNAAAMVRLLIDAGIDPNILDKRGYSMLCSLSAAGDELFPDNREIYKIIKTAGGRCIAPEVKFL